MGKCKRKHLGRVLVSVMPCSWDITLHIIASSGLGGKLQFIKPSSVHGGL
jgi:hypothetical protein